MKNLVFVIVLIFAHSALSQDAAIELIEQCVLYRGYENLVKISPSEKGKVSLVGSNVTITQKENGDYVVVPGNERVSELFLVRQHKNKADTLYRKRYAVLLIPDPTLYWGPNRSGGTADRDELILFAKLQPGIMLIATHRIEKWRMIYGDLEVSGYGSDLGWAKDFLAEIPNNGVVTIECEVKMPEGHVKNIYGVWTLKDE